MDAIHTHGIDSCCHEGLTLQVWWCRNSHTYRVLFQPLPRQLELWDDTDGATEVRTVSADQAIAVLVQFAHAERNRLRSVGDDESGAVDSRPAPLRSI